jgi:hypothetical protein
MTDYVLQGMWRPVTVTLTDRYSGSKRDLSVVEPKSIPDGWYWWGQRAADSHLAAGDERYLVIRPHPDYDGEPLAQPLDFKRVWGMSSHGLNQAATFGLWSAAPPNGYEVLSDIFNHNSKPRSGRYVCVSRAALVTTSFDHRSMWDDKGSAANDDGSVWEIRPPRGAQRTRFNPFRANNRYLPPGAIPWVLNPAVIEMVG